MTPQLPSSLAARTRDSVRTLDDQVVLITGGTGSFGRAFVDTLIRFGNPRKVIVFSRDEQKRRFLERIDQPAKNWKFSANDAKERAHWAEYMHAYEETIRETSTSDAPWYVVPADNKWFTRTVVAAAIVDALASLDLHYPKIDKARLAALAESKKTLLAEKK